MARYIQQVLQPGEKLVYTATLHWILYVPGVALLVVALLIALWAGNVDSGGARTFLHVVAAAIALVGAVWAGMAWLQRFATEIDVTDRRVVYKRGFIKRHTVEMNMDKVESVDVDQTIMGRVLNYGDVTVNGTGEGWETLHNIGAPLDLRNKITAR